MISKSLLHNTLSMQSTSRDTIAMRRYIRRFAKKIPNTTIVEDHGNIYITKGNAKIYPCVIAHTDTVHKIIDDFVVNVHRGIYSGKNRSTGKQVGVGGDDKVGIAIALQALETYDVMKVAFFRDEEIGCVGSRQADMDFFDDCAFVIQCDRRGNTDVVQSIFGTRLYSKEFSEAIQPFLDTQGFREVSGSLTDVYMLRKNGLQVASFNMSAGYHAPHTSMETVTIADVNKTYAFVTDVIENLSDRQWFTPIEVYTAFSLFEEEEENEEYEKELLDVENELFGFDNDDMMFLDAWIMSDERIDRCPICEQNDVIYDDTIGGYFCMICQDFIFITDEVEV